MSESGERRTFLAVLLAAFILSATWATFSRSSFARRGLTFMSSSAMVCGLWKGKGSGRQQQVTWGGLSHVRTRPGNSSSAGGGRAVPRATDGRLQPEPAATLHLLLKGAAVYPDRPSQACVEPRAALSTNSFTPPLMPPPRLRASLTRYEQLHATSNVYEHSQLHGIPRPPSPHLVSLQQ